MGVKGISRLIILPAGKTVRLEDGSVVALHASAHGAYLAARREGRIPALRPNLYTKGLDELARLDHDMLTFFEASGVRSDQIEFMYALTSTSDVQVVFDDSGTEKGEMRLTGAKNPICRTWLLDSQALKSLGIRSGEWRASGRFKASLILGEKYDQIYDGQVVPIADLGNDIDCAALRAGRALVPRRPQ